MDRVVDAIAREVWKGVAGSPTRPMTAVSRCAATSAVHSRARVDERPARRMASPTAARLGG